MDEELITAKQASAMLGYAVKPPCIRKWMTEGLENGTILLTHLRIGGRLYTRAVWLTEFMQLVSDSKSAESD
jgi:hypothetical protein